MTDRHTEAQMDEQKFVIELLLCNENSFLKEGSYNSDQCLLLDILYLKDIFYY